VPNIVVDAILFIGWCGLVFWSGCIGWVDFIGDARILRQWGCVFGQFNWSLWGSFRFVGFLAVSVVGGL
jgi:hypothetical protein